MYRSSALFLFTVAAASLLMADDSPVVFRSEVALVKVDAQVVDRDNRAITGLSASDFILLDEGKKQEIRNFENENMPVDVLFLLDVSGSMRPHVERIASAAHDALRVLGDNDRVAIMVFDRMTRVRMPFRESRAAVEQEFDNLLRDERFNGGTDITRGMLDAANYVRRNARREARRAIVILTDDQTEMARDDAEVQMALTRADAVMMALIAPDAMYSRGGYGSPRGRSYPGGGGYPGSGGGYPGSGGGIGGPLGGIIFGRRGGYGGRGGGYPGGGGYPQGGNYPGGVTIGGHTHSAGTSEIARASGGDSVSVDDASALEDTLSRIRQRYALHFYLPAGAKSGEERTIQVTLSAAAQRRYPGSEVRYRREYLAPGDVGESSNATVVTRIPADSTAGSQTESASGDAPPRMRRRRAVNEDGSQPGAPSSGPIVTPGRAPSDPDNSAQGGWKRAGDVPAPAPVKDSTVTTPEATPAPADNSSHGGWRKLKPGEKPD